MQREMVHHQWMAVQCSFFHCDRPTLLGFVCVCFSALQALLLLQYLLVPLLHIKALCSSNGKLVLKGAVSPSSETCVGTFHGTGKWKDRDGARLFHWPSGNVLWPCSTSSMDTFPAIAVVSIPESHQTAAQLPPCLELRRWRAFLVRRRWSWANVVWVPWQF